MPHRFLAESQLGGLLLRIRRLQKQRVIGTTASEAFDMRLEELEIGGLRLKMVPRRSVHVALLDEVASRLQVVPNEAL